MERVPPPVADRVPRGAVDPGSGGTSAGGVLGGSEGDIAVRILGGDLDQAFAIADEVARDAWPRFPSLGSVRGGIERGQPELGRWRSTGTAAAQLTGIGPRVIDRDGEKAIAWGPWHGVRGLRPGRSAA